MITLGEFKRFLAICGYPQAGSGVTAGKPSAVRAQSAVAVPHTGTTNETTLATIAIPAGAMGVSGALRVITVWSYTNSANNKTFRARLGGSTFATAVVTTTASSSSLWEVWNRNAANSQVSNGSGAGAGLGASGNATVTLAVDTSVAQNLTITAQLASAGETITLEAYTVEILNP